MAEIEARKLVSILESLLEKYEFNSNISYRDEDMYWCVPSSKRYSMEEDPELFVGSLIDDTKELLRVANGETIPTCVDFDRLASLLHSISDEISSYSISK